jgi:hypothetical protein
VSLMSCFHICPKTNKKKIVTPAIEDELLRYQLSSLAFRDAIEYLPLTRKEQGAEHTHIDVVWHAPPDALHYYRYARMRFWPLLNAGACGQRGGEETCKRSLRLKQQRYSSAACAARCLQRSGR